MYTIIRFSLLLVYREILGNLHSPITLSQFLVFLRSVKWPFLIQRDITLNNTNFLRKSFKIELSEVLSLPLAQIFAFSAPQALKDRPSLAWGWNIISASTFTTFLCLLKRSRSDKKSARWYSEEYCSVYRSAQPRPLVCLIISCGLDLWTLLW